MMKNRCNYCERQKYVCWNNNVMEIIKTDRDCPGFIEILSIGYDNKIQETKNANL